METTKEVGNNIDRLLKHHDLSCQLKNWKRVAEITLLIESELSKLDTNEIKLKEILQ